MGIDAKVILALFDAKTLEGQLCIIDSLIQKESKGINYFFCGYSEIDNALVAHNLSIRAPLSDETNPLIYVFLTQKLYFISNVLAIPAFPAASLMSADLSGQCILFPINKLGVLGFYSSNLSLNSQAVTGYLNDIADLFTRAQEMHRKIVRLEKVSQHNYQEFIHLQKRDNHLIKQTHIDQTWIDLSGRGVSFKRDILFYSQTNNPLNIIGQEGAGKTFLAMLISQLRNTYTNKLNIIDLAKVNDVVQLNSLFEKDNKRLNLFDLNKESSTLILQNLHDLSPVLFNALYERLYAVLNQQTKLITTTNSKLKNDGSLANQFFLSEMLHAPNRLENEKNFAAFFEQFLNDFCKDNLKQVKGIHPNALNKLRLSKNVRQLDNLRQAIYLASEETPHGQVISTPTINKILQMPAFTTVFDLAEQVASYEKKLILKSLALNNWSQKVTAKQLGLPRRTLNYKCNQLNIKKVKK